EEILDARCSARAGGHCKQFGRVYWERFVVVLRVVQDLVRFFSDERIEKDAQLGDNRSEPARLRRRVALHRGLNLERVLKPVEFEDDARDVANIPKRLG